MDSCGKCGAVRPSWLGEPHTKCLEVGDHYAMGYIKTFKVEDDAQLKWFLQ